VEVVGGGGGRLSFLLQELSVEMINVFTTTIMNNKRFIFKDFS
jgi:hypothetical protein